jgi:hypothetical protein
MNDQLACAAMAFTNDCINFPVTHPGFLINNIGPLIYADPVDYPASGGFSMTTFVVLFTLLAKVLVKIPASVFVMPNMEVDTFMAD